MARNKDIFTGEDTRGGHHVEEEMEFYDMGNLEDKLFKRLSMLESKVDSVLEEVQDNNERIKNIQFQFTKQTIIRVVKWAIIIGLAYFVYSQLIEPVVSQVAGMYIGQGEQEAGGAESIFRTIMDLFPEAGDALDTLRPGTDTASSTVEN